MVECTVAGKRRGALLLLLGLMLLLAGCASGGGGQARIADGGGWVTVQRGDTLGKIANQAGIPLLRLQRFNPGVDSRRLAVGQRLLLPSRQERAPGGGPYRYQVRRGDSLYSIARYFGANPQRVQAANTGIDPSQLAVGQLIQVPLAGGSTGRRPSSPAPAASRSLPDPGPLPSSASGWRWPLENYTIERRFGRDAHGTLQPMMLSTSSPATAKATTSGKVRFASGMRQLGQVVILHHADNMQSVYAFCDKLMVSEGQSVSAGGPLCEIGKESGSNRYHLLFDLRHGGKPVDPARVLR
ncbi:peptidase M23 [Salinicola acroporae]|uniref:Peptidase M23 n=2 Tax=Salinicola acroporae TaxID=1541440 RepID=A0ABT6I6U3_9GAMM|nr:peptidase M23 [Salinicola acroporae]